MFPAPRAAPTRQSWYPFRTNGINNNIEPSAGGARAVARHRRPSRARRIYRHTFRPSGVHIGYLYKHFPDTITIKIKCVCACVYIYIYVYVYIFIVSPRPARCSDDWPADGIMRYESAAIFIYLFFVQPFWQSKRGSSRVPSRYTPPRISAAVFFFFFYFFLNFFLVFFWFHNFSTRNPVPEIYPSL